MADRPEPADPYRPTLLGGFGLIATNTIGQGDTREVGLDHLTSDVGLSIHRAVSSTPWPGGASLEMSVVWASRSWNGIHVLDQDTVPGITPSLAVRGRTSGNPRTLAREKRAFIGSFVNGAGFVLTHEEATALLEEDSSNARVVRPYLIGDDLNSRPDASPSRWVVDFRDWPEQEARHFEAPFARLESLVRPVRAKVNREAHRRYWWRFGDTRPSLYRALHSLDRCIALTRYSKVIQPVFVPTDVVISEGACVFAYDDDGHFGVLSCGMHWWWTVARSSTMGAAPRYTPTDCFETFPQPDLSAAVARLGCSLNAHRSAMTLERQEGLTTIYGRVHDPDDRADDVVRLREIHVELDHAVRDAYGWTDLDLGHGFHDTKLGTRYTFAPVPRQEVLDRLLELNHARYADEVRQGLHGKKKAPGKPASKVASAGPTLFDD